MNKLLLPLVALCTFGTISCSDRDEQLNNGGEAREVRIVIGGEYIDINEQPMGRSIAETEKKTYIGINIYRKFKSDATGNYTPFLYGVFDNENDIIFTAQSDFQYKFVCTTFKEDRLKLARFEDGFSHPFRVSDKDPDNSKMYPIAKLNKFVSSTNGENIYAIGNGNVTLSLEENEAGYTTKSEDRTQPSGLRFYGEKEGYTLGTQQQVNLELKNASIAIKIKADVPDGKLTWSDYATALVFEDAEMMPGDKDKIYYFSLPYVSACWRDPDNQYQSSKIIFEWTREYGGSTRKVDTGWYGFKRNVMTTITLNLETGDKNINFTITQEDAFTREENIDLGF